MSDRMRPVYQFAPRKSLMKLPICLIGEDSLALASFKQQLEKEASVSVDPRIYGYGEAFEMLKGRGGVIVAVVDINRDAERAFSVGEQIKSKLGNVRLGHDIADRYARHDLAFDALGSGGIYSSTVQLDRGS